MVLRIFKIIATSGLLAALECTKFVLGRDSAPDPAGGAYRPSSWFKGPTSKGKGARRKRGKGEKKGREKEREGPPPLQIPGSAFVIYTYLFNICTSNQLHQFLIVNAFIIG